MESPITTLTNAIKHWAYDVFSAKEATADAQATADEARAAAGDAQAMASVTVVTLTEAEDGTVTADMTVDEVAELVGSGRRVVAVTPFYNRVTIDQVTKTTSNRNSVLGTLLNGNVTTRVTGAVLVSGDKWTASETDVNTADRTYVGDFYISVDASNGAIKTSGPHSDGTSRSRTMALATDLTSLSTRVDALEGAGGGGTGADWNAAEGEAGYIANKPFGKAVKEISVTVEAETPTVLEWFKLFDIGDTVTITVDGVEHVLVAFDYNDAAFIGEAFENLGDGTGLEWTVGCDPYTGEVLFYSTNSHTVSYVGEVVTKISDDLLDIKSIDGYPVIYIEDLLPTHTTTVGEITIANNYPTELTSKMSVEELLAYIELFKNQTIVLSRSGEYTPGPAGALLKEEGIVFSCIFNQTTASGVPVGNGQYYPGFEQVLYKYKITIVDGVVKTVAGSTKKWPTPYASTDNEPMRMMAPDGTVFEVRVTNEGTLSITAEEQ